MNLADTFGDAVGDNGWFASGGGGSVYNGNGYFAAQPGGGGRGDYYNGEDGTDGTGGGCGAKERQSSSSQGTRGGSGIVIIRMF